MKKPKERGEWAELRFMAKAAELGFKLSRPWGDSATYDVVIELKGRFVRIQIKSTMCKARGRKPHYFQGTFVANMRHISVRRYQESDFDYLAVYVIPKDTWYIIPSDVATQRIAIRVCPGNPKNQYEGYREAWQLLRQPQASITLHAVAGIPMVEPFMVEDQPLLAQQFTKISTMKMQSEIEALLGGAAVHPCDNRLV